MKAKGYLLLSERRSGTHWVTSLLNKTMVAGHAQEWINYGHYPYNHNLDGHAYCESILQRSMTTNHVFAVTIFPRHLRRYFREYDVDFIRHTVSLHDVAVIFLYREDRLRQAISLLRAEQTKKYFSTSQKEYDENYDFRKIAYNIKFLEESNAFWKSYLSFNNIDYFKISYEKMLQDSLNIQRYISKKLELEIPCETDSELSIQRDETTEEWVRRFTEDCHRRTTLEYLQEEVDTSHTYARTFKTFLKFIRKIPLKTYQDVDA